MDNSCPKTEQWADISGKEGYQASDFGQICKVKTGRILTQRPDRRGHGMQVDIGKTTCTVHDLIARAFHGRPPCAGYRVKHRNGDLTDNRADNLIWSGAPLDGTQAPTITFELEVEYNRVQLESEALSDLMQI